MVREPRRDNYEKRMTFDAEGYVWCAHWGGTRISRYDRNDQVDQVIEIPVPMVASMAFGGKNLKKLFVTTPWLNMEKDQIKAASLSGGLFVIDVDCESMQETIFCGETPPMSLLGNSSMDWVKKGV